MPNTTFEAAPSSPPRDLTVVPVEENPSAINLNWQPPKQPNGQITGEIPPLIRTSLLSVFSIRSTTKKIKIINQTKERWNFNGNLHAGYVIFYTTDSSQRDRDWVVEGVVGDKMTTTIKGLTPDTTYFIKIQARNNKGYGPFSSIIQFRTNPSTYSIFI